MRYPISHYLNVQNAYAPAYSADGEQILFLTDISGAPQVWRVPAQAAQYPWWPEQLTFGQERIMGVWPSPQDNALLFTRDIGGNEKAQLFLLNPDSGVIDAVTEGHEEAMHLFGCWAHDGAAFFFAANRRHPAHFDLYRYDRKSGQTEMLWQHDQPGYLSNFAVTRDASRLAFVRSAASFAHDLFELNLRTSALRPLSDPDTPARYGQLSYTPGGLTLYLVTDLESDFMHVRRLEPASRTWEAVATPNWDVELLAQSASGRFLAYTVNVGGRSQIELIDMARGVGLPLPLPQNGVPQAGAAPTDRDQSGVVGWFDARIAFSPQEDRLIYSYSSATRASDIYSWHLHDDEGHVHTRSSHGGLPVEQFVAPDLVEFPTFDERHIPAWYYRPPNDAADASLPVVVIVHGGPESQTRPTFNFLIQYLVHNGYAVLAPNVRGSTGYGKAYSHLDDVERRMDSVADLAHAAHWLRQQPEIDPQRIAVYGGSYGGFMVLAALTHYPDLWAAGVDIVGISNFTTFLENTSDYRRGHREAEYGSLARDRDFLESIAPMRHIERLVAPLMVIHGANDPRVPLSEAEQLVAALRRRDVPVEFLVFDDEGHGVVKLKNKLQAYPAIVAFLDRYV